MYLKTSLFITLTLFFIPLEAQLQTERNLLSVYSEEGYLTKNIETNWHPFPTASETEKWKIWTSEDLRKKYIQKGDSLLGYQWEVLPVIRFIDFYRNGNRVKYENLIFGRRKKLAALVMAELLQGKGLYMEDIVNGIWSICEETFWGLPAHIGQYSKKTKGLPDPDNQIIDLFNAETGSLIAWSYYLLGNKLDSISPFIRERMYEETNRRLLKPLIDHNSGWMGFDANYSPSNWNPWINSNLITCILLMEKNTEKRNAALHKCMSSLNQFINRYPEDGGCDEGPGYWNKAAGALCDALEILYSASNGKINIYNNQLIKNMGSFVYKAFIYGNDYVNFADASLKNYPDPVLIYTFGKRINDIPMQSFAAYLAKDQKFGLEPRETTFGSLYSVLMSFDAIPEISKITPEAPYIFDAWLPKTEFFYARSINHSSKGFYLAGQGGHNAESHNHNDVGNFIIFFDGKPLIIDAGVGEYTSKTFGSNRYDIWTMQSAYHNVPTINGAMQAPGKEYKALNANFIADKKHTQFTADIAAAYPKNAQVKTWYRNITLNRNKNVVLNDSYQLNSFIEPFYQSFMSYPEPIIIKPGIIEFRTETGKKIQMQYNPELFECQTEKININDSRLSGNWEKCIYRTRLISKEKKLSGSYKIIFTE